jgi:hypothetical protein
LGIGVCLFITYRKNIDEIKRRRRGLVGTLCADLRGKKMTRKQRLQNILDGLQIEISLKDYNLKLPDGLDEKGAGGIWDLAGKLTASYSHKDEQQSLVYHLIRGFLGNSK